MAASTRFAVAAHILAFLAFNRDRAVTSEELAASARTNPAVIRRLLGQLARAGLTASRLGKGGGAALARAPKKISLLEIYLAVEAPGLIAMPRSAPAGDCRVGRNIQVALGGITGRAEATFYETLAKASLRDVVRAVKAAA